MSTPQDRILALQSRITSLESTISTLLARTTATPPPSTLAIAFATALLAALAGYFYCQYSSLRHSPSDHLPRKSRKSRKPAPSSWPNSYDVTIHPDSSDSELMHGLTRGKDGIAPSSHTSSSPSDSDPSSSDEAPHPALTPFTSSTEEHKLTLVLRTDLSMTRGKMCAQASHATLANYRYLQTHSPNNPVLKRWERGGQAKVALQVKSEEEIMELQAKAVGAGLCARVVRDAGRTQIKAGSVTCLGVGPGPRSVVDGVTGGLKLL
jgi:PTH2 family peptidyl-tRNA hydrolase